MKLEGEQLLNLKGGWSRNRQGQKKTSAVKESREQRQLQSTENVKRAVMTCIQGLVRNLTHHLACKFVTHLFATELKKALDRLDLSNPLALDNRFHVRVEFHERRISQRKKQYRDMKQVMEDILSTVQDTRNTISTLGPGLQLTEVMVEGFSMDSELVLKSFHDTLPYGQAVVTRILNLKGPMLDRFKTHSGYADMYTDCTHDSCPEVEPYLEHKVLYNLMLIRVHPEHQKSPDPPCQHYMFLCRVLVGDSAPASKYYTQPPEKPDGSGHRFDSCYGADEFHRDQVAIYDSDQAYAQYLIQYTHCHKDCCSADFIRHRVTRRHC